MCIRWIPNDNRELKLRFVNVTISILRTEIMMLHVLPHIFKYEYCYMFICVFAHVQVRVSVLCVLCDQYCGKGSPVHAGAADVEMLPVHHPEGREDAAFDQRGRVHIVDFSI